MRREIYVLQVNGHAIALVVFDHACRLGLEGIVSKRRDAPYRSGRSGTWLKVKNREHPATDGMQLRPMRRWVNARSPSRPKRHPKAQSPSS